MRTTVMAMLMLSAGVVRAQEPLQAAPPPSELPVQPPQPLSEPETMPLPPVPAPIVAPPPPSTTQPLFVDYDQQLAARGHRNKVTGGVLMGVGSALLATGEILLVHDLATHSSSQLGCPLDAKPACDAPAQYDLGELVVGALAVLAGSGMLYSGIPIYVVGGAQVRKAERHVTFAPQLSARGGGGAVRLEF